MIDDLSDMNADSTGELTLSYAAQGLTTLEIACSVVCGREPSARLDADERGEQSPRSALGDVLARSLRKPPCFVSFSGGRDSTLLLAAATAVARREGLPEPVPITARYPGLPQTDEENWQRRTIERLALKEWVIETFADELDLVGPVAVELIRRRGLPYPYNVHLQLPLIERARGGTFVTGLGGDEVFTPGARALAVVAGHVRPTPKDALRLSAALAPRGVRRRILRRRRHLFFPWLRPRAAAQVERSWVEDLLRFPLRWDARLREWWRSRYLQLTIENIARLGSDAGVEVRHPFADPRFVLALSRAGGLRGFPTRAAALRTHFSDVLPTDVSDRLTKASFDAVLWNRHSRAFVAELLEGGLESALRTAGLAEHVDATKLAAHWTGPQPAANSFLILQACWLALHQSAATPGR